MSLPQESRSYTYEDYLDFPNNNNRWELIDGVKHKQVANTLQHDVVIKELCRQFDHYLIGKSYGVFTTPFDLILPNDVVDVINIKGLIDVSKSRNVVQPDMFVISNKNGLKGNAYFGVPVLIIEVCSPYSIKNDLILKFHKYEDVGVKEYWIVEPEGKFLSIYTLQENKRYGRPEICTKLDKVKVGIFDSLASDSLIIDLKLVFN